VTNFRESSEFLRGRAGELAVAEWLKRRECYVIPSYDFAGEDGNKSPKLQGLWRGHPVPDLDVSRDGNRFWVEVKTKKEAVLWRKTNELRHGIERRLLEHYRTVEAISGCPCWLFVFEESTGALLAQKLSALGDGHHGSGTWPPMTYWPRAAFRELDRIGIGADALCPGSGSRTASIPTRRSSKRGMKRPACMSAAARTPLSISPTGSSLST